MPYLIKTLLKDGLAFLKNCKYIKMPNKKVGTKVPYTLPSNGFSLHIVNINRRERNTFPTDESSDILRNDLYEKSRLTLQLYIVIIAEPKA